MLLIQLVFNILINVSFLLFIYRIGTIQVKTIFVFFDKIRVCNWTWIKFREVIIIDLDSTLIVAKIELFEKNVFLISFDPLLAHYECFRTRLLIWVHIILSLEILVFLRFCESFSNGLWIGVSHCWRCGDI